MPTYHPFGLDLLIVPLDICIFNLNLSINVKERYCVHFMWICPQVKAKNLTGY